MGIWDSYQDALAVRGSSIRDAKANRERQFLARKMANSLSYHPALVNGVKQELAIINSDNLNQKTVCSWQK